MVTSREGREYYQKLRETPSFGATGFDFDGLRQGMATRREPAAFAGTITRVEIGSMHCEWVVADGADPDLRLLYLHGGGFISGSAAFYLPLAAHISVAAQCAVLLLDYRLAPEHRFPAGLEDCIRAHNWLTANGPTVPAPAKATFLAGDSAGGNLTLAALLALRDRNLRLPNGGIALSPFTDMTLTADSIRSEGELDPIMHPKCLPDFVSLYMGNGDVRNPLASPVFGDYTGIPPLLIQVGEHEIIRDDSVQTAAIARAAGVDVTLEIWEGMFHVFQSHDPLLPEGRQAIEHIADFMRLNMNT
jgi:acetyl esterase/lipase